MQQFQDKKLNSRKSKPLVSIVIPSFNQGDYLKRTLLSVFEQNYPNKEIIVMDGGSKDQTVSILKANENKIDFWISEPDNGQAHAINKGFSRARGEYFYWINSDDILFPGAISRSVERLEKIPNPLKLSFGKRYRIDEVDEVFDFDLPPKKLSLSYFLLGSWIPQETAFFSKPLWEKLSGLDDSFQFALDYDLLVRAFLAKATFAFIDDFLGAMRFHNRCKSCNPAMVETQTRECRLIHERIIQNSVSMRIWQKILNITLGPAIYHFSHFKKKTMKNRGLSCKLPR